MDKPRNHTFAEAAKRWFRRSPEHLDAAERRVLEKTVSGETLAMDTSESFSESLTFGQRMADQVARVGGSWGFIGAFALFLAGWGALNTWLATQAFDPYPFIFLNLMLSMLAAVQAPVIMMSQNRQATKDRLAAAHDYEVNLKAEIEIMALHDKLDQLRSEHVEGLIARQQAHIEALTEVIAASGKPSKRVRLGHVRRGRRRAGPGHGQKASAP